MEAVNKMLNNTINNLFMRKLQKKIVGNKT